MKHNFVRHSLFCLFFISFLGVNIAQEKYKNSLPIGVFDSGTGGLTVLEAMLTLDAFNNTTGKAGADGKPDFETYMHRIGRAGRFGTPGLAVTIYDRELDEKAFWNIIKHYKMEAKVQKLDGGPNQIASLLDGLTEKGMD